MGSGAVDTHELVAARLRGAGQRYTTGRRELVELLGHLARPATIAELLEARPRLTQSSLYRNMADLESVMVVQRVLGTDELTRFELSEDIIGHHHHTICVECGAVDDFTLASGSEQNLEASLVSALGDRGFQPSTHRLDVLGTCAACS